MTLKDAKVAVRNYFMKHGDANVKKFTKVSTEATEDRAHHHLCGNRECEIFLKLNQTAFSIFVNGYVGADKGNGLWKKLSDDGYDPNNAGLDDLNIAWGTNAGKKSGYGEVLITKISDKWNELSEDTMRKALSAYSYFLNLLVQKGLINESRGAWKKRIPKIADCMGGFCRNLIVFGAPGTGKSRYLDELRLKKYGEVDEAVDPDQSDDSYFVDVDRVTFYPTYSYAQFVGSYKPWYSISHPPVGNSGGGPPSPHKPELSTGGD